MPDFNGGTIAGNLLPDVTGRDLGSTGYRFDAFIQALDVVSWLVSNFNGVRFASQFSGATTALKVAAAAADLAGARGVVVVDSTLASGQIDSSVLDNVAVIDLRGTGGMSNGAYSTTILQGITIYTKSTVAVPSGTTNAVLNIFQDLYSGGTNASGNKSNYAAIRAQQLIRTEGQHTLLEGGANDETMGDVLALAGIIDTSGGNISGIGNEGKIAIRGRISQQTAVFSATVASVSGNIITYSSPSNELRLGEGRFLINTSANVYSTGQATTVASNATVTESGGADFEAATASGVLDGSGNPRFGFSLDSEVVSSTLKYVTPITAVAVGGTTLTLRNVWSSKVTGTTGNYKIFKGSEALAVDPDNNKVTVSDGTLFTAGDTIEQPLDNRFDATAIFVNISQQIADSGLGTYGISISNSNANARAKLNSFIGFGGNAIAMLEATGVTIRPTYLLNWNSGTVPSTWFNMQDNVNNSVHTIFSLNKNSGAWTMVYDKSDDSLKFVNAIYTRVQPVANATREFDVAVGGVPHFQVGSTETFINNGANFGVNSGNQAGRTFEITAASGNATQTTANGAQWVRGSVSENLTLSTSGLTTDTSANLLPANAIIEAVACRVTTTITTTTNWAVGDGTTSNRFSAANATLTSGTTSVGLRHQQGSITTDATGPVQTSAAPVRITCTGANPGAGAIRITVFYSQFVAPTS